MASVLRIVDLNGKTINIIKGRDQSWAEVVEKANLPARFDFCLRHWMGNDEIDDKTEQQIKNYLDRVGYILIQDKPDSSIITDYKELRDKVALIPVSGYPQLENFFYATLDEIPVNGSVPGRETSSRMTKAETKIYDALTKPRQKPTGIATLQEKRKRIDKMREDHPDAVVDFVHVDTENVFFWRGVKYQIDRLPQYEPKAVKDELLYDMDQVACLYDHGEHFYDQNFNCIDGHVTIPGSRIGIYGGL